MEERIQRKDLWDKLGNLDDFDSWLTVANVLGCVATRPKSGTHIQIRNPKYPETDIRGLISTINREMSRQTHGKIFKRFLDHGFKEDAIWQALGMLENPGDKSEAEVK